MEPARGKRIKVTENGPYIVTGRVPLSKQTIVIDAAGESSAWEEARIFEERETCGLCRCGSSESKPFCDGSHLTVGFDGTETASNVPYAEAANVVLGPRLGLADVESFCAEARFCHREGGAWHLVNDDSDESAAIMAEECVLCPSGRYTAIDRESGRYLEPDLPPSIGFVQDTKIGVSGPIWARGGIVVESAAGEAYEVRNRVTLCRCGQSENKPFCDGSHCDCDFHDGL